jgi:succinyl-CoA synthetase beta subunit
MNIHEFEAKQLLAAAGIPVPPGKVVQNGSAAKAAAAALPAGKVVVKAQIHAGGRGKGSLVDCAPGQEVRGVRVCASPDEAAEHTERLIGHLLRTHQTGPGGQRVKQVLVEAASNIAQELYAGITLDRGRGWVSFIVSTAGGMDIEEVAEKTPEKIFKQPIDPTTGIMPFHVRRLTEALQLTGDVAKQAAQFFTRLYHFYIEHDASLVEINPLVITTQKQVIALDAKLNFDDNALFRRPQIAALRDVDEEDDKERQARDANLSYVALDGSIGCLVNGAGLAMATMDIIKLCGGSPANFLDVGGGATKEMVTQAFKIILMDTNVRAILVNIFGGIAKCDVIGEGVVAAAKDLGLRVPLVVRLEGTNVELGKKILANSGLKITTADNMLDAAQKAVAAARGAA